MKEEVLLDVRDLHVSFAQVTGTVRAVNGVSFKLRQGEVLGVVGESGCGKSVSALSILGLLPMPPAQITGQILLNSRQNGTIDVTKLPQHGQEMRELRGKEVSMIFQEPMRSLHPMFSVGHQIMEGLLEHHDVTEKEAHEKTLYLLERVGLPEPGRVVKDYPHNLSGGMRQRAMIAIALACNPRLLIADEPTTALDVTIQAQILELVRELQQDIGLSIMLITHDLGVIAETAERVLVMYLGTAAEYADTKSLFENPMHPYTQALLETAPTLVDKPRVRLKSLEGVVPELKEAPKACVFADRCDHAFEQCMREAPPVIRRESGHEVRCWLYA
jgi:oligopeptide/dipeptide ABC transporter ATP-binding protein